MRVTASEPAHQFAPDIGDLAGKEQCRSGVAADPLDHVLPLRAGIEHRVADAQRLGDRTGHRRAPYELHRHWRDSKTSGRAHIDRDAARECLQPEHVDDLLEDHHIALLIGDRRRRRLGAIDEERRHLHFGKGPAHAVAVDHRQAGIGRRDDRLERVRAADLGRDQRRHLDARHFFDRPHGAEALAAFLDLFDTDHRRPDTAHFSDPCVVRQCIEWQHAHACALADQLARPQHTHIGIAAAAGAQERCADRQGQQVALLEQIPLIRHATHPRP